MPRSCWSTKAAGGRPSGTSRNGSIIRPARSRARSRRSKRRRRRSPPRLMWVRSRLLARSAIAISASRERGGGIIRGWWPGSTALPRACRPSPRPSRRARPVSGCKRIERTKSPGPEVRGSFVRRGALASEAEVRPAAKHVGGERYVASGRETAIEAAVEVAEIDVKVLGLQAHIADEADLEAGADGPAGVADAAARQERRRGGVDVAEREPAGEVGQEAVEGDAQPPAYGGEPLVAGLAAPRAQQGGRPFDARPVDVAFGAKHRLAELPVVTDGAADEAARYVERIQAVPLGATPAATAVDTDVEAGPGVDRIVGRPRLVIGRQIGGCGRASR